jgi:hypothetical protein
MIKVMREMNVDLAELIVEDFGHLEVDWIVEDIRKTLLIDKEGFEANNFFVRLLERERVSVRDSFANFDPHTTTVEGFLEEIRSLLEENSS